jgi:excisionase family DNA binding protein
MEAVEKMYSVKEVAGVLGWSPDTIRRLIYRGHLKAVLLPKSGRKARIYRVPRIRERDVKRFLDSHTTE